MLQPGPKLSSNSCRNIYMFMSMSTFSKVHMSYKMCTIYSVYIYTHRTPENIMKNYINSIIEHLEHYET